MPYFDLVNRTVIAVSLATAVLGGLALALVWYMSFGLGQPPSGEITFSSMRAPATLSYREDGMVSIEAGTELDAYRALGFRTGRDHAWVASLFRQTATGRLSEWFGAPTRPLDRFALTMGFGRAARAAVGQLASEDLRILTAFADGLSEALATDGVALGNQFVLFDVEPDPWETWHTLAIERMLAWLSEPPLNAVPGDSLFWPVRRHEDADRTFRTWLHLHGADMSAAWTWSDSTGRYANTRLVYGATALPLYAPASMSWPGVSFSGVMFIGTPFFPIISGRDETRIVLPSSRREVEVVNAIERGSRMLARRFARVVERSGDEHLVEASSYGSRLLLSEPSDDDSVFSATTLAWRGVSATSDWPTWRNLANRIGAGLPTEGESAAAFALLDGDGLSMTATGAVVTGTPVVTTRVGDRIFIANNPVATHAARRIGESDIDLLTLRGEEVSEWARTSAPRALNNLGPDSLFAGRLAEATAYLRNWDYRYDVSSIGASIFDSWMLHYRPQRGDYPVIVVPTDSVALDSVQTRLRATLKAAVDSLAELVGEDLARWRLESFRPGRRHFPVWSYPALGESLPVLNRPRYAPIEIAQSGHPTSLLWQPGMDDEPANSPSHILAGGRIGEPSRFVVRPDYQMGSGFIARYVAGPPRVRPSSAHRVVDEVILTPR